MEVGEKIRKMRELHSLSQEEMANKLHMSVSGYGKIERGEARVYMDKLTQIAQALDIDVIDLLSINEKNVIIQTHNQEANYYKQYVHNENLQNEIDKLELVVSHLKELLQQKDNEIQALKDLVAMYKKHQS